MNIIMIFFIYIEWGTWSGHSWVMTSALMIFSWHLVSPLKKLSVTNPLVLHNSLMIENIRDMWAYLSNVFGPIMHKGLIVTFSWVPNYYQWIYLSFYMQITSLWWSTISASLTFDPWESSSSTHIVNMLLTSCPSSPAVFD